MPLMTLMSYMAIKTINIEGLGKRTLAVEPMYRIVDSGGRVSVGKNLVGKELLILACLPEVPNDLAYGVKPKQQVTLVDAEVFQKRDLVQILQQASHGSDMQQILDNRLNEAGAWHLR